VVVVGNTSPEGGTEESLELLQRRSARLKQVPLQGSDPTQAAAQNGKPGSTMMITSFRKLTLACHNQYGNPERCSDGIVSGAADVFDILLATTPGTQAFSMDELQAFKTRFKNELIEDAKKVQGNKFVWDRFSTWKFLVSSSFKDMKPGIPQALVDFIQASSSNLSWTAKYDPKMVHTSVSEAKGKLGLESSEEEKAELLESLNLQMEDLLELGVNSSLGRHGQQRQEPTGPFDVREQWPECREVMGHVRFQDCNNCWSHSTALITESRVCIILKGGFKGRDAWLSQSYVAACRPDGRNYCAGGAGTLGFKTVSMWGMPTGASDKRGNADPEAKTCYPQIPARLNGISCPASCSQDEDYPRDLSHDTFFAMYDNPRAFHPSSSAVHYLVKTEIMQEGPVMMGFTAYMDLQAYQSGIYRPAKTPENLSLGGHAVTVMGFGPGYYLCTNSWGDNWGENGTFKIAVEAVNIGFYLPGKLSIGKYGRFPMPVP